jgi:hypothetical protein
MSRQATFWAWAKIRSTDLPFRARLLLLALADRHNADNGQCNPGIACLCADTAMYRETIMEAIKSLESENIIAVQRKLGAGSSYQFIGFELGKQSPITDQSEFNNQPVNTDRNQSADTDQLPPKNQSANTDPSVNTDPDQSVFTDSNQSVNTDTEPYNRTYKEEPIDASAKKAPLAPDAFAEFYKAYPNKKNRKKAEAAWKKLNPDKTLQAEIMAGLARAKQSRDWQKDGGQYIPHPATWLNGRRWEDDVEPAALPKNPVESFLGIGGLI